jgi:ABC-type polar amino acid transport system ATPase subunit
MLLPLYIFLTLITCKSGQSTFFDRILNPLVNETIIRFNKETVAKKITVSYENQCKISFDKNKQFHHSSIIQNIIYLLH